MSEEQAADLVEVTTDIVTSYVMKNHIPSAELPGLIATVHAALAGVRARLPSPKR